MAINPKNVNKQYRLCNHFSGCTNYAVNIVSVSGTDYDNIDYESLDTFCPYHTDTTRKHAKNRGLSCNIRQLGVLVHDAADQQPSSLKKTKSVVIGTGSMGFDLSIKARDWLRARSAEDGIKGDMPGKRGEYSIEIDYHDQLNGKTRHDPLLVQMIDELGKEATFSGDGTYGNDYKLSIVEIPDDVEYQIESDEGIEHIAEKHRKWGLDTG